MSDPTSAQQIPPYNPTKDEIPGRLELGRFRAVSNFAEIKRARLVQPDGTVEEVSAKSLRWMDMNLNNRRDEEKHLLKARYRKQLQSWTEMQHPRILPIRGYQWYLQPFLVIKWYENGNITQYLRKQEEAHIKVDKIALLKQIAEGLIYLHGIEIVHGRLHPSNIIISDEGEAMLCDFGIAQDIKDAEYNITLGMQDITDIGYAAPETLERGELTPASDVYTFGAVVLEVMSGKRAFGHLSTIVAMRHLLDGGVPQPEDHPLLPGDSYLWTIMNQCWASDPKDRPSMSEVATMVSPAVSLST
ncbi:hypothetical protein FRB99_002806 [Tulasnella sp. 403]|nr:hypothetical protein FRB99_002806 [Tulasnella sp. 403]